MTKEEILSKIEDLQEEVGSLKKELNEPKFERVNYGDSYYTVENNNSGAHANCFLDFRDNFDNLAFFNNNYFHTRERAQEVADKINFLLKLERLHDTYCPDYKPNFENTDEKFYVFYSYLKKEYRIHSYAHLKEKTTVYFDSEETAQKVCDILNEEKENEV